MPKNMSRNKRGKSALRARSLLRSGPAHSVKELLARSFPIMKRVTDQAARQSFWNGWLSGHIPQEIRAIIFGVVERDGSLVIFAESAAWSPRLRYTILELEREIRAADPELTDIDVRVLPR